jgi:hypothetical protein
MLVGEATDSLAKGESGGHRITGLNGFKRGFPHAPARRAAFAGRRKPAAP